MIEDNNIYKDMPSAQLINLAESNDIKACCELSIRFYHGTYILDKDEQQSDYWLGRAESLAKNDPEYLELIDEVKTNRNAPVTTNEVKSNVSESSSNSAGEIGCSTFISIVVGVYFCTAYGYEKWIPWIIIAQIVGAYIVYDITKR